jgi:ABC-type multidrug transport system ATPase subunit
VYLPAPDVSRQHLQIERIGGRFYAKDLTNTSPHQLVAKSGSRLNGKYFSESALIFGDRLAVGSLNFRFDGKGLLPIGSYAGAAVKVSNLFKQAGQKTILNNISLDISPGEFVGILGTSGAGKSTFMDAICGIRPPSSGIVTIDGTAVNNFLQQSAAMSGYVPQADIIHLDLTVREAIWFSALLRLPRGISHETLLDCLEAILDRLGLSHVANIQISKISGGQQKRVSIAAEMLARPFILFLDEPSSGLDPATESKLMGQLRDLANLGCTVICTTHVMENVHAFDSLVILSAGRLIFKGSPAEARSHFEISRFSTLYERIESRPVEEWCDLFRSENVGYSNEVTSPLGQTPQMPSERPNAFRLLMSRQTALLFADWKAPILLIVQPVAIGSLLAWMGNTCAIMLFIGHLAAFWFGCSNASQEIVKESAIYRRERMIGVGRFQYLLAKGIFWTCVGWIQAAFLFISLHLGPIEIEGDMALQVSSLAGTTLAAVAIGLALSAWVKTATQATRAVPLILIPQIVLAGYVLPPVEEEGAKRGISELTPSHASQALMDISLLWRIPFDPSVPEVVVNYGVAHRNIQALTGIGPNEILDDENVPSRELKKLLAWCILAGVGAYFGLKRKERE